MPRVIKLVQRRNYTSKFIVMLKSTMQLWLCQLVPVLFTIKWISIEWLRMKFCSYVLSTIIIPNKFINQKAPNTIMRQNVLHNTQANWNSYKRLRYSSNFIQVEQLVNINIKFWNCMLLLYWADVTTSESTILKIMNWNCFIGLVVPLLPGQQNCKWSSGVDLS